MTPTDSWIQNRYRIASVLGGGATGVVYLGQDTLTGENVAIKQLRTEITRFMPQMVERFKREGEILGKLDHPNIVKMLASIEDNGEHYIIMEYVAGGSLAEQLQREPKMDLHKIVSIGLELSDALSRAHHLHILHRDFKPGNILLAEDGTPRLTDFGLARADELPPLTETGSILGTFSYICPEALEGGKVNERSDIWSFGVVLFEMLTGTLPFKGETPFDLVWAIKNQTLPVIENFRSGIPPSLAQLVRKMLRKDNPARLESARQVGAELESIQKEVEQQGVVNEVVETTPLIRVLIADDHAVVRQGLQMFINLQEDMQVVGEAHNGSEAVAQAAALLPDVVLLDLIMPELNGVQATGKILEISPKSRVLILTSFSEDDKIIPAIAAGAKGYLLKDIAPEDLTRAIREVHKGKTQLHPDIAAKLMSFVSNNSQEIGKKKPGY